MQLFKSFLLFMSLVISDVVRVGGLLFAVNYFQNFTIFPLLISTKAKAPQAQHAPVDPPCQTFTHWSSVEAS